MARRDGNREQAGGQGSTGRFWLEAVAATIGAVLAVTTIGFIVWRGLGETGLPPELTVELVSVAEQPAGYLAEVVVRNGGESTAANVVVEGTMAAGGGASETAEFTIDYVPSGSERRGGLLFAGDPRRSDLDLRASGYAEP